MKPLAFRLQAFNFSHLALEFCFHFITIVLSTLQFTFENLSLFPTQDLIFLGRMAQSLLKFKSQFLFELT